MVERLKDAITRAREERARRAGPGGGRTARERGRREDVWDLLQDHEVDPGLLAHERVITHGKTDPAHTAFDMLRTKLVKTVLAEGRRHIGISSPTKGCGKTVVSANLGMSFARNTQTRVLLLDLDTRSPRLSRVLGLPDRRSIRWLLDGSVAPEEFLLRAGEHFALGLNREIIRDSSELLQSRQTAQTLRRLDEMFSPDIVLYDLPPLLVGDEAMSFMQHLDGMIMVIAAGQTKPNEIEECEALLGEEDKLLGILLNKANPREESAYYYNYGYQYGGD